MPEVSSSGFPILCCDPVVTVIACTSSLPRFPTESLIYVLIQLEHSSIRNLYNVATPRPTFVYSTLRDVKSDTRKRIKIGRTH